VSDATCQIRSIPAPCDRRRLTCCPELFKRRDTDHPALPPSAATILQKGRSYIAKFDVAYTLSPADDAQRSSLEVMAVVSSHDANGSFLSVIGSLAYTPPQLTAAGGVVTDSIGFTVPSNASFISVGAGIVARGGSISNGGEIGPYWSVQ
jgi:hypothetical protein